MFKYLMRVITNDIVRNVCLSIFFFSVASYLVTYYAFSNTHKIVLDNPANAISSVSYAIIDAPPTIKLPLLILSIASYNLWAKSNPIINFIDVTCIFWTIVAVTIFILPNAPYSHKIIVGLDVSIIILILLTIFSGFTTHVLDYYRINLVVLSGLIYGLCSIMIFALYGPNKMIMLGASIISFGFICKILTIFFNQYWGTCIFHIATALGIGILLRVPGQIKQRRNSDDTEIYNPMYHLPKPPGGTF
jgi:hypothetical protein